MIMLCAGIFDKMSSTISQKVNNKPNTVVALEEEARKQMLIVYVGSVGYI